MGATPTGSGVRFTVFSRHATRLWLEIFARPEDREPVARIPLTPERHRFGDLWSVFVAGIGPGALYAYRAEGPYAPEQGHRFNPAKLLLDPYARAVTGSFDWDLADARGFDPSAPEPDLAPSPVDSAAGCPKCIVVENDFDWGEDRPPTTPLQDTVIYEVHVRGFTVHPSAGVSRPGTYLGLLEKVDYLKSLGVTAVELLPVQEFDPRENLRQSPVTGQWLGNYWGYSTVSFFAPVSRYAATGRLGEQVREFKQMVKGLHAAGIEVILDVVFNHTAEGDETGPTLCFRGLDNAIYYMLGPDRRTYRNFSGCGNTLNCNHPLVRDFILDCLRYWVLEMHVDGFRFDLASVLGRDGEGNILGNPPVVERIAEDPVLRHCKIIAEAWDAAGAYQVGQFPGRRWAEWNGRYRDDVRRFWRGDPGMTAALATRLAGSADLYQPSGRSPLASINYVTSHDGFTLADLVSYARKHNEANGEDNRDGMDENFSWNCGLEGETDDPNVLARRDRDIRNLLATLTLSQGVPMLLGGDEMRRSQQGNNNAYCQDNEMSWFDWSGAERHAWLVDWVRALLRIRRAFPSLRRTGFFTGKPELDGRPDVTWHGAEGGGDPFGPESRALGCWVNGAPFGCSDLFFACNAGDAPVDFRLPASPGDAPWHRLLDSAEGPGQRADLSGAHRAAAGARCRLGAHAVFLWATAPLPTALSAAPSSGSASHRG